MATVRGNEVVQVGLRISPFPARDHDVALGSLRPRWLAVRQLTLGDPVGPITKILERRATEVTGKRVHHQRCSLSRLHPPHPCLLPRFEFTECRGNCARGELSQLV